MKKMILMFTLLGLMVSCNNSNNGEVKESANEKLIDSLSIKKVTKLNEIKDLNTELDSLKRVRDSLNAISE